MSKIADCIFWLAILAVVVVVKADDDDSMKLEDLMKAVESFSADCDPKPEEEHIRELILNIEDAKRGTRCLRRCLMDTFELVNYDFEYGRRYFYEIVRYQAWRLIKARLFLTQFGVGQTDMDPEKTVDLMGMMFADREDDLSELIKLCNEENKGVEDKCDVAHAQGMCTMRELKARNFPIPDIKE